MKKNLLITLGISLMFLAGAASATVLIDLNADSLTLGDITEWANEGTKGGLFLKGNAADPNIVVEMVDGRQCVTFNGTYMQSNFTTPAALTGSNPWSVMVWAYEPEPAWEDCMVQWADRGVFGCAHFNFGGLALTLWDDVYYNSPPPGNEWVHLTATYDGATVTVYINGIVDVTSAKSLNITAGCYMRLAIALPDIYGTHPFTGSLARIQMHDRVLTKEEIQAFIGVFEAGTLGPETQDVTEGTSGEITIQLNENPNTASGPSNDVEVTLSIVDNDPDIYFESEAPGASYIVTIPASNWDTPVSVTVTAVDDTDVEATNDITVTAEITGGDPDYLGQIMVPAGGIVVSVMDDDWAGPCDLPTPFDGFFIDPFECPRDFNVHGVEGSIWTGFMGFDEGQGAITIDDSLSNWGVLTMSSTNSSWEGNSQSGPFLYRTIAGDFVAETYVADYPGIGNEAEAIYHNDCGIMVRVPVLADAGAGEDDVQCSYFPIWGVGNILRYNDDGVRWEGDQTFDAFAADRYLQVERCGNDIYCRHSPDGVNWTAFPTGNPLTRADFDGLPLQVGLQQAVYSSEIGWVEYEYFKVKQSVGEISGSATLIEALEESTDITVSIDPDNYIGTPNQDVVVTITPVGLGDDPNSNPEDVRLGAALPGESVDVTFTTSDWMTPKTVVAAVVNDDVDEGTQLIGISYVVTSGDPNFNEAILTNLVQIQILDNEPGINIVPREAEVWEAGASDSIAVSLLSAPDIGDVTVNIFDWFIPINVIANPSELTFTSENWMTPQPVAIIAVDDDVLEGDPHWTWLEVDATATAGSVYELIEDGFWMQIHDNECGAWTYFWADFDQDCVITLSDFAELAAQWMLCTTPNDPDFIDLR